MGKNPLVLEAVTAMCRDVAVKIKASIQNIPEKAAMLARPEKGSSSLHCKSRVLQVGKKVPKGLGKVQ